MSAPSEADLEQLRRSVSAALDRESDRRTLHDFVDGKNRLDETLWRQAADLGWLAVGLPEEHGGLGLGVQGLCALYRELGRRAAPGPFLATLAGAQWLREAAEDDVRRTWLPRVTTGELRIAIPANVPSAGSLTLKDGVVRGVSALMIGAADSRLAIAPMGEAWALIELGDSARFQLTPTWDRTRATGLLVCDGATPVAVIQDPNGALARALARQIALASASDSLGAADAIFAQTLEFMGTRVQFDRVIASFQALKHRAADLQISLTHDEALLEQAIEAAAHGTPDQDMWAALAKAGVGKGCVFVAEDCMQLHGGIGHTWEYDCHIFLKRIRLNEALGQRTNDQYDFAAEALAEATRQDRTTTELA